MKGLEYQYLYVTTYIINQLDTGTNGSTNVDGEDFVL